MGYEKVLRLILPLLVSAMAVAQHPTIESKSIRFEEIPIHFERAKRIDRVVKIRLNEGAFYWRQDNPLIEVLCFEEPWEEVTLPKQLSPSSKFKAFGAYIDEGAPNSRTWVNRAAFVHEDSKPTDQYKYISIFLPSVDYQRIHLIRKDAESEQILLDRAWVLPPRNLIQWALLNSEAIDIQSSKPILGVRCYGIGANGERHVLSHQLKDGIISVRLKNPNVRFQLKRIRVYLGFDFGVGCYETHDLQIASFSNGAP